MLLVFLLRTRSICIRPTLSRGYFTVLRSYKMGKRTSNRGEGLDAQLHAWCNHILLKAAALTANIITPSAGMASTCKEHQNL